MNLDCKVLRTPYRPVSDGSAYYVQRWGTRDKLKATTEAEAIEEARDMPGAEGVVRVEMRTVWVKNSGKRSKGTRANMKSATRGLSE